MRRRVRISSMLIMALIGGLCAPLASAASPWQHPAPKLVDLGPCAEADRATCGYLEVPLDRRRSVPDRLRLRAIMADNADAPRGVLMLLSGGPGQPGLPYFASLRQSLAGALNDYRLVMIDQRGTGETAIRCPQLQQEVGSSDVQVASVEAIRTCAEGLGERRNFYTSAETVADLDDLRAALGVRSWTLDGVSYGTFVAQQYALTHPGRTRRLVLDSVVQQDNADPLYVAALGGSGAVLRTACREQSCPSDPARDLAEALRRTGRAVDLLDTLIVLSIIDPKLTSPQFLDDASHELRTPITIIRGHLEVMGDDPAERVEVVRLCTDELDRMSRIVTDLLVLATAERPDFVRPERVEVAELTEEVDAKVRALGRRCWRLETIAEGGAWLDPQRITQAMVQLAQNAVQHSADGDVIRLGSAKSGGTLSFWVADSGPGVAPQDAEMIFQRFTRGAAGPAREHRAGAGLGLAIVSAIAEAHGGSVTLLSEPGRGARFTVELPAGVP